MPFFSFLKFIAMKQKIVITMCCLLGLGNVLMAQDSTIFFTNLQAVEVSEKRATPNLLYPKMNEKGANLASFLDNNTGALVKFNGPVGINSVNLGGIGGQHTALNWNGLNLQSGMNGFADLNLIPMFLFDEVGISTDFGDMPLGSGLGGSVNLNTYYARNELFYSFASFNNHRIGLAVNPINTARTKFGIRAFRSSGDNDFTYVDGFNIERKLDNAHMVQTHLMPTFSYKINQKSQIKSELWYTDASRGLPPTLFETEAEAQQEDRTLRSVTSYYHNVFNDNTSRNFSAKLAYKNESIVFDDPLKNLHGDNRSESLFLMTKQSFSKLNYVNDVTTSFFVGATAGLNSAKSLSYPDESAGVHENLALNARFQQHGFTERWLYNINVKTESFMGQTPWSVDGNFKYRFKEKTHLDVFVGRAYRFPTFNDLYWIPGGNPDLETETAYKGHVQLRGLLKKKWNAYGKIHSALVDNWIMWLPNSVGVWEVENVKSVWARGLDIGISGWQKFFRKSFQWNANYSFMRTENLGGSSFVVEGSQLSYVPLHKGNLELKFFLNWRWNLEWQHQYVGRRYINTDNSEWLKSYQLDNLILNYTRGDLSLSASFNNVFNTEYTSTAAYPMPGRNFNLSIRYGFNRLFK